ncbi:PQQ-binding-like beta-propeller repeat protein [Streptomyces sp. H27-C3]|uniref:outer membrane protein assembly factor BamB family protein n=1 Tax=Streptomyces sp. H27-C3 TaxID=3046305 RepID=UPI0024BAFD92|nr:PQQ-binding-like beta-propeller repeat protein [Streptomyces sp. H27-C3]MDJ0461829.1 hypothetical protein [Streptomyces sp. H27-C3]
MTAGSYVASAAGHFRRSVRVVLTLAAAVLALPLVAAAHQARPAPYGDHLTVRAPAAGPDPALRTEGGAVEAYDGVSGRRHWTYTREGRRPLALRPAPGHAFALWSDGLITDTARADGRRVHWHRAVPGLADWLAGRPGRAAGVLQALDPQARMLAVVTPRRIAAYRTVDGDLRWVLPAARGCTFEPHRSVHARGALIVAQSCGADASWTGELVAVDDLGRITPDRTPLGNAAPGDAARARKSVAGDR